YCVKADRTNRLILDGCYGEEVGGGAHVFNITSRTQQSVDGIIRINDKLNVGVSIDDVPTGFSGSTIPWSATRCMVTKRVDGRDWTPNLDASRSSGTLLRLSSFATGGAIRLAADNGS